MPGTGSRSPRARRRVRISLGARADPPRLALELHRLVLEELLEAVRAGLPPVARLLEAAERGVHVEPAAVDVDLAGAHPPRDPLRAGVVARPHAAGEAVDRVVGDPDRVLLVLV